MVNKIAQIFNTFDTNQDGKISVSELRDGLSRMLSASINDEQARKIMQQFDTSGDGALQLDEFQTVDSFRVKFEKILFEERKAVEEAQQQARLAKIEADKLVAISSLINNKPPTSLDRILSILPFLLPLLDSLPFGGYIIKDLQLDNNPVIAVFGYLYLLYQTVPFSGLIAFFLFNILSTNLRLNRLVRYNIQLAIFLDILLIFPGIVSTTSDFVAQLSKQSIPPGLGDLASDATFILFISTISYAVISSLLGQEPDKIPFVTDRIKQRVPTTDEFLQFYREFEQKAQEREKEQAEAKRRGKDKDPNDKSDKI